MNSKMKRYIVSVLILSIVVSLLMVCFHYENKNAINNIYFTVKTDDSEEKITVFENKNIWYVFLPSYANLQYTFMNWPSDVSVYIDGVQYEYGSNLSQIQMGKELNLEIKKWLGIASTSHTIVFEQSSNISTLSIRLTDGVIDGIHNNKNLKLSGVCSMISDDGEMIYNGKFAGLSGRGNSSWGNNKKSYNIEFDEPVDLFGVGESNKFCLVSNACDESNLRNKIAYDLAIKVGLQYAIESTFVDLYIGEQYYGLYLLTESIEVGKNQVDIADLEAQTQKENQYPLSKYDKFSNIESKIYTQGVSIPSNPKDITGGYLFEFEQESRMREETSGFITAKGISFSVKSPQCCSREQIQYISKLCQEVETALSGDFEQLIDVESWVATYMIREILANGDGNSFYYYKDSDSVSEKLFGGPVWDFDMAMGTCYGGYDANPKVFRVNTGGWQSILYNNPDFLAIVKDKYSSQYRVLLEDIINNQLPRYKEIISNSHRMNQLRWDGIQSFTWCNHYETLDEHIDYLRNFLILRMEFLDSAWHNDVEYKRVVFASSGVYNQIIFEPVVVGECLGEVPDPVCEGYKFIGYFDGAGNKYDPNKIVYKDLYYTARWEPIPSDISMFDLILRKTKTLLRIIYEDIDFYLIMIVVFAMVVFIARCIYVDVKKEDRAHNGK